MMMAMVNGEKSLRRISTFTNLTLPGRPLTVTKLSHFLLFFLYKYIAHPAVLLLLITNRGGISQRFSQHSVSLCLSSALPAVRLTLASVDLSSRRWISVGSVRRRSVSGNLSSSTLSSASSHHTVTDRRMHATSPHSNLSSASVDLLPFSQLSLSLSQSLLCCDMCRLDCSSPAVCCCTSFFICCRAPHLCFEAELSVSLPPISSVCVLLPSLAYLSVREAWMCVFSVTG